MHIADGFPSQCMGDPTRIRQILINLLSNAVKFTEKGSVSLYVDQIIAADGTKQVCITVTDTGIGIDAISLKTIFSKYVQADSSISRKYGGTGLGLSISQDLVHLMHGKITIESRPGVGSHFIVTLPLKNVPAVLVLALEST